MRNRYTKQVRINLRIHSLSCIIPALIPFSDVTSPPPMTHTWSNSYAAVSQAKISKVKSKVCTKYLKAKSGGAAAKIPKCDPQQKKDPLSKKCDRDKDYIKNRHETLLFKTSPYKKDSDGDSLSDAEELCISLTDPTLSDSDGDGIPDGSDPDSVPDTGTTCDQDGNTNGFGIPTGTVGNIYVGETNYQSTCTGCHHPPLIQGQGMNFGALDAALRGAPMFFNFNTQKVADLTAYLNSTSCTAPGATPTPGTSPTPTPSPTPPPTSGQCDSSGNTTSFGVPAPYIGNTNVGSGVYQANCYGCHPIDKGTNYNYSQLHTTVTTIAPMSAIPLSTQQIVDLVAYLNRANCDSGGTPTPTPSPPNPVAVGHQLFISMCSSCHTPPNGPPPEKNWTPSKIYHAFHDVDQMQALGWEPDLDQRNYLYAYFQTLP